jgi:hypothetical protein
MKSKSIIIALLCASGCSDKEVPDTSSSEGIILEIPGAAIASSYDAHRQENKHTTSSIAKRLKKTVNKEIVEIELDKMSFREAFNIQYRAKGEGHTFWWNGDEYTTNLLVSVEDK